MRARRPHQAAGGRAVPAFVARRPACSVVGRAGVLGGGLARADAGAAARRGQAGLAAGLLFSSAAP